MDFKKILVNFISRKLLFSGFSILAILFAVSQAARVNLEKEVLMVTLPCVIIAITLICVTYITGLAKIDIAASASYGKKD